MTSTPASAAPPDTPFVLRSRLFEEMAVGDSASADRVLAEADLAMLAALSTGASRDAGDAGFALAREMWAGTLVTALVDAQLPGPGSRCLAMELRFTGALQAGMCLSTRVTVTALDAATRTVTLACSSTGQDGELRIEGQLQVQPAEQRVVTTRTAFPGLQNIATPADGGLQALVAHVAGLGAIKVAVVHPCDEVSLTAAWEARAEGLIDPVLFAPRAKLEAVAAAAGLDLSGLSIVDVPHSHAAAEQAAAMAGRGEVEALMKGSLHTDEVMGAVVASAAGLRTKRRISHCFVLQTPHYPRPFIVTDAAINIAPDLEQKADIVRNAIDLATTLDIARPKVAILAAVETVNPSMQATLDAAALCKMADRGQISGGVLDGPLAFDNAVSLAAAQTKGIVSPVAGQADILVVPDLESGNMLAKQLIYLGQAASAGIVLGAKVPIILTSRADNRQSRIASCAIAVLLAHRYRTSPP